MNLTQDILKNTAFLTVSRLVERASGLVLAVMASRFVGPEGFGVYSAALAYYGLITVACEMGATNLLVRQIAKDRLRTSHYVCHMAVFGGLAAATLTGVSLLVVGRLGYSPELAASTYIVVLAILPGALKGIQEAVFVAHRRVEFITVTTFLSATVNLGVSFVLLLNGFGIVSLVVSFVLVQCVAAAAYYLLINRYVTRLRWAFRWSSAPGVLRELKPFAASSILGAVCARPEIIILSFVVLDESRIGYYAAALKLVDMAYLIPRTVMVNVFPVLSSSFQVAEERFQRVQDKSIKYLLALSLPMAVGLMVAAEPIIQLVFGAKFSPSVVLLRILAWNVPLFCLHAVLWRVLSARDQQGRVVQSQLVTTLARIGGGSAMIAWLGGLGAAISVLACMLLHNALLWRQLTRLGASPRVLKLSWRFAAAALVMGGVTFALLGRVPLIVLIPLAAAVYFVLAAALGGVSRDDRQLVRHIAGGDQRSGTRRDKEASCA